MPTAKGEPSWADGAGVNTHCDKAGPMAEEISVWRRALTAGCGRSVQLMSYESRLLSSGGASYLGRAIRPIVQNRSDVHLKDCIAYVRNAPQHDGSRLPRFVETFDLPPKSKKTVVVAYWFSPELRNTDDKDAGNCFGGNVCRVPGTETNLHIRIDPQDAESKHVHCRMWVDTSAGKLRAEQLPD